ncbi:MAG: RtcB family protein [Acidobacteriota bacterium]
MFVIEGRPDTNGHKKPIKVWLNDISELEESCMEQALNLADLPFIHKWVALMPDTHMGYGMPIGGVIATKGVIIPNAVGVDIGCGMGFLRTNIPVSLIRETDTPHGKLVQVITKTILREIPVGFAHHKVEQESVYLTNLLEKDSEFAKEFARHRDLAEHCFPSAFFQLGTLGGGNHFIELQEDTEGNLCVMLHSGSRNVGKQVCDYFNKIASELNDRWQSAVPAAHRLAFLPLDEAAGQSYLQWMNMALAFARENREAMKEKVKSILFNLVKKHTDFTGIQVDMEINAHHNYAAIENHYGENVWVHRKGAIRVREDELGIVPGAMGRASYIVKGLGNPESFHSCSHGAGRKMGRKKALASYTEKEVLQELEKQSVVLGTHSTKEIADESPFVYKDIDDVIAQEADLAVPVLKLQTVAVVKG